MEKNKIFIGNLSYDTTIEALVELFSKYGEITDSYKPQGKGFAFITFSTEEEAQAAIEAMNGQEVDGRDVTVNIARPRENKPRNNFDRGGRDRY
jgi:RNA recognition motif-containing protein